MEKKFWDLTNVKTQHKEASHTSAASCAVLCLTGEKQERLRGQGYKTEQHREGQAGENIPIGIL